MIKNILLILTLLTTLEASNYVGDTRCQSCHQKEHALWHDSYHDLAMKKADASTVLGKFDRTFEYNGIKTTFYKQGKRFMVRTENFMITVSPTRSVSTRCSSILFPFPKASIRYSTSPGTAAKKQKGASVGFTSTPMTM